MGPISQHWCRLLAVLAASCIVAGPRAEAQNSQVPAKFGYPLGTVWHQVMLGPQAHDPAASLWTAQYFYVLRSCGPARCRDFMMVHVRTHDQARRKRERYFDVKELSAEPATVIALKRVAGETTARYEVVATTANATITLCLWPKGFEGYRAQVLPHAGDVAPSCPEVPEERSP